MPILDSFRDRPRLQCRFWQPHFAGIISAVLVLALGLTAETKAQDHKQTGAKAGQTRSGNPRNREQTINELGAVSKSELALPFVAQWRYLTDSPIVYAVMIDASKVYIPLARGRIICLDRASGALLWGTDLGGRMTSPPALSGKGIYVSSVKVAADGSEAGGLLRVLDTTTGLTLWQHEYTRPFTSPIVLAGDKIYAGSADGALYALKLDDGSVIWKCQTADVVQGEPLVTAKAILFGSDDGALRGADPQTGLEMWKFQTAGKIVDCPAIFDGHVFLGSGDGYVYCLTLDGIKLKWRFKAGAAVVAAPVIAQGRVLIGSYDDFFYTLSKSNGDKIWKRRFEDRITWPPIVSGDALMVTPYRGDHVAVFLLSDGRRVNYYQLDPDFETVAAPVYSKGVLFIPTDHGLVVTTAAKP